MQLVTPLFPFVPKLGQPKTRQGGPATLPHSATMEDEADTPTEQRPLVARGTTRYGRAAVAGAALLSSGLPVSYTHLTLPTKA